MRRKSVILSVTGASGTGKTTVVRELLAKDPKLRLIQSTTTRSPRDSDVPGEYRYVKEEKFYALKKAGNFLWTVSVHGSRYGTLKSDIDNALREEETIFLIILVPERITTLATYFPEGRLFPVYIAVADPAVLAERLRKRGDDEETIARRLRDCADWDEAMKRTGLWHYTIFNDGPLARTVAEAQDVIRSIRLGGC